MKKSLYIPLLVLLVFQGACTSINKGRPRTINSPKRLDVIESKGQKIKPIPKVEAAAVTPYNSEKETVRKLFDFSNTKQNNHSYTPYYTMYEPIKDYNTMNEDMQNESNMEENRIEEELSMQQIGYENYDDEDFKSKQKSDGVLRIGVVLPLSSSGRVVANDLKNAATMALFHIKSENILLQFYDSKGTKEGAKIAVKKANNEGVDVIVGPLFADEVVGAASQTDVPILSFTTDQKVLSKNVFSIGFLLEQQIKRIVEYASQNGYKSFAIIVPDNETGTFIKDNFNKYAEQFGTEVVVEQSYHSQKEDLMNVVKEVSDFEERVAEYKQYSKDVKMRLEYLNSLEKADEQDKLKDSTQIENSDESSILNVYEMAFDNTQYISTDEEVAFLEKTLEELPKKTTISDPKFDSIFIYGDDINDVIMIGSSLMYYDVHPDRIKFIGTSQLENPKVYTERAFRNAWYPSVSTKYSGQFDTAYRRNFGKKPSKIASLAYDAVALIGSIGTGEEISYKEILNPNGWTGINGIFRFKYDGSSERNMDVKQVLGGKITKTKVVSPAELNFMY